jgi:hypothetical protein
MSQSQPVIPVTMQYGESSSRLGHELHHIEREVYRTGDSVRNEVSRSKDQIRDDVRDGTSVLRSDLANDTASIVANLVAQANADQAQTRSSQIEARQAVERNADKILADSNRNSDYVNNAIQQTSVATALAVQNTSSDTKSQILDTRRDITAILTANFAAIGVQAEKNAALTNQIVLTQAQAVLLGQKDAEVNASNNRALLALQAADYKAASSLQASEYTKDIQLQASTYKAYLENHITKTSSDGLLKTAETTAKIMEKLAECCCENKMAHASTQNIVMQNGNNNQAAIQQGQVNQLTQALAAAQNEALMAKIANSVITTSTNVGTGTISK